MRKEKGVNNNKNTTNINKNKIIINKKYSLEMMYKGGVVRAASRSVMTRAER